MGLVLEVDTMLVAEIVPIGIGRVVRVAHVVDIRTLHQEDLPLHLLMAHGMTCRRVGLMTTDATELDGLAVDVEVATSTTKLIFARRCILDLDLAEASVGRSSIEKALARLVVELGD